MDQARLVFTDSGGIQEETTVLGVPCLTFRDSTERPITITEGTNHLVGLDPARTGAAADAILAGTIGKGSIPELWDGGAGERIVRVLEQWRRAGPPDPEPVAEPPLGCN
jgi:UDP-N-acetylglucosamine 2-epimerase (non-hydrolysing)